MVGRRFDYWSKAVRGNSPAVGGPHPVPGSEIDGKVYINDFGPFEAKAGAVLPMRDHRVTGL